MKFKWKKTENCFAEARTYEYELPITGQELSVRLEGFEVKENHSFRRPVFSAKKGGLEVKGILKEKVVKINYTADNWRQKKNRWKSGWKTRKSIFQSRGKASVLSV